MKKKTIAGSIGMVMIIMICSRLLALISTQVYLSFYGAGGEQINIYSYAISIPNIIFNCFGTALATVVIPVYTGHIAKGEKLKAKKFADNIITISTLLTVLLVIAGIGLSFVLPKLTAFGKTQEGYSFAVKALMIMMPVMLFYGLNYIFQGMLQSMEKYAWPAFVSVPSSLAVIGYVLLFGDKYGVFGLLVATLIGLSLQAIILIFPLSKMGYRYSFSLGFRDEDIVSAGKMTLPVLIGVSAYQFNMFFNNTMIANYEGMVTLLTYVQNITLYMVLAVVYSMTAVIYPKLTESAARGDMEEYKRTLRDITKTIIALLLPLTFGFIALRFRLLDLIARWGKITSGDVESAAKLLMMYSIGIVAIGLKEIYDRAFYAVKNTKIPAVNGFIIMVINVGLCLLMIRFMGPYGIPLSYSIASVIGASVLLVLLRKKVGSYAEGLLLFFIKCLSSAFLMFVAVSLVDKALYTYFTGHSLTERILLLCVPCFAGIIVYGIIGYFLKIDYVTSIINKILKRGKANEGNT